MARLNYHHLHYFWAVAKEGNLTRAASHLHVSQSALSTQIRQLEQQLEQTLFDRNQRTLVLTEAGRMAMGYAETIFNSGAELVETMRSGQMRERQVLRVGAQATLSRNFQANFLSPLLESDDVELVLQSGSLAELLARLRAHTLDLVLSNEQVVNTRSNPWRCREIATQAVSLVGKPREQAFKFPDDLHDQPLLLPGSQSEIRTGFDLMCERLDVRYQVRAEIDDMALLRLMARDTGCLALVPTVVVQDELTDGRLVEHAVVPDIFEAFYATTVQRHFEPPVLKQLLNRDQAAILANT